MYIVSPQIDTVHTILLSKRESNLLALVDILYIVKNRGLRRNAQGEED